jgi:hypothetical protein
MTLAPRYRAEAEAFREYADAVEELEPPDLVQDDHENLVTSSRDIADGLDELADLVEEEPQSQEIITRQEEVQQDLANLAIEWNLACLGIDLPAADHDVPCNVVVAQ